MRPAHLIVLVAFAVVLGVPFLLRPARSADLSADAERVLIVVTPHVEQIRAEFAEGFDRWHRRVHGEGVRIDYRVPGGTTEILKQLQSQYAAAIKAGRIDPVTLEVAVGEGGFPDLMFGGGSYDHGEVKKGVRETPPGASEAISVPMSVPAGFSQSALDEWFGENRIGAQELYDPEQYWIGVALSSFGIVYNRDVLAELGVPEPDSFEDLCDPRLQGWVALADPRQSGSITTTFDSILGNYGWDKGWRVLREMAANARYFTNSSTKPPIDVSQGEAAMGLAIDFYGRTQAQAVLLPGQVASDSRVGYVDPKGAVYIDADPVSILRGGNDPQLARRFVEFCLSDEGQALWQFHAADSRAGSADPPASNGVELGPRRFDLRRLPVRRDTYARFMPCFVDQVDPFELASDVRNPGWRTAVQLMMGAFAIDIAPDQREAWAALNRARSDPGFPPEILEQMESLFYAWPDTPGQDGTPIPFSEATYQEVRARWRDPALEARLKVEYTLWFRENYRQIVRLERDAARGSPG